MDKATRELRRRNKAIAGKRGSLPTFEARGQGRKNKPADTFATRQCDFIIGGKKIWIRRSRKTKTGSELYMIPLIKGGTRCIENAFQGGRCPAHMGVEYGTESNE